MNYKINKEGQKQYDELTKEIENTTKAIENMQVYKNKVMEQRSKIKFFK